MVEVPGDGPMFYDTRAVPHGTVQARLYSSKSLDRERRLYVYTPPGYERSTARYPVLYLLHGASGDDSIWTWIGHANLILDNLMADGKLKPLVVVMPDGYAYPPIGPVPAGANQRAGFERDLLGDILPFVQTNYRVYADRDHRAIAGLSMGGGQALSIGLGHLDLFSRVAGFSSALVGQNNFTETYAGLVGNPRKANDQLKLLWTGCGTDDTLFNANKSFADFLESSNIKHTFRPSEGAHTWQVWRRYLAEVAPLLFPHS
jgi:enterochelin esterase family protein